MNLFCYATFFVSNFFFLLSRITQTDLSMSSVLRFEFCIPFVQMGHSLCHNDVHLDNFSFGGIVRCSTTPIFALLEDRASHLN